MKAFFVSLLFVFFIIGCENYVQPVIETDNLEKNSEISFEFPNLNLDEDIQLSESSFSKLYFATSISAPKTDIVITGTQTIFVNRIVFLSLNHDIKIEDLSLKTSLEYVPTVGKVTLSFPTENGTGTAEGYFSSTGELTFINLVLFVKKLELAYVDVYYDVSSLISEFSISGLFGSIDLNAHGQFKAEDLRNGKIDTNPTDNLGFVKNQNDCLGNPMLVRKTEPTLTLSQLSSITLTNGQKTVSKFSVSADSHGSVGLRKISWEFEKSESLNLDNFQLYNSSNPTISITPAYINIVGNKVEFGFMFEEIIPAGTNKTFELKAFVTGSTGQNEFVKFKLSNSDSDVITSTALSIETQFGFIWSDMSQTPHSFQSNDWTNGYLISTLQQWQQLTN